MEKELLNFVVEKTHELMNAPTCSSETKTTAQTWLNSIGTDNETAETKRYIYELAADIMPIESLIGFAESDEGAQCFGAGKAKIVAAHGKEIQSAGMKYCDCPACAAAEEILKKKDIILT